MEYYKGSHTLNNHKNEILHAADELDKNKRILVKRGTQEIYKELQENCPGVQNVCGALNCPAHKLSTGGCALTAVDCGNCKAAIPELSGGRHRNPVWCKFVSCYFSGSSFTCTTYAVTRESCDYQIFGADTSAFV